MKTLIILSISFLTMNQHALAKFIENEKLKEVIESNMSEKEALSFIALPSSPTRKCEKDYKSGCQWVDMSNGLNCLAKNAPEPQKDRVPASVKGGYNFFAGLAICPSISKNKEAVLVYCIEKSSRITAKKCLKSSFETESAKGSLYDYCKDSPEKCFPPKN